MTIAKTSKRAAQLINSAAGIKCFSLSNGFTGTPLTSEPVAYVAGKLTPMTQPEFLLHELSSRSSKLSDDGNGKYSINVHSNLWFEFQGAM